MVVAMCRTETMTGQSVVIDSGATSLDAATADIHAVEIRLSDLTRSVRSGAHESAAVQESAVTVSDVT
jgi:hypothetical protein